MARGLWHYLKNMPPIDVDAIAQEYSERFYFGKKGPQPVEWAKKAQEVIRANKAARRRAATERARRRQSEERRKRKLPNLNAKILNAMEPGNWYGRPDIEALSGAKRGSIKARMPVLERAGLVERAQNPEWAPTEYPKGTQIHFQARGRPPQWLFRLTQRGERERRSVAFLA